VARQRQRARDRKQRQREQQSNPGPRATEPHRENVPGSLDHASGVEEEFEAGIVSGAEGEAADDDGNPTHPDIDEVEIERQAIEAAPSRREGAVAAREPGGATTVGGNRFVNFLRASWAELQRVQWPDRRQVAQATGVVLGFVIIAGLYLGLADWVAQRVVDFVL
jgi:preprotein translocase subunit SecE